MNKNSVKIYDKLEANVDSDAKKNGFIFLHLFLFSTHQSFWVLININKTILFQINVNGPVQGNQFLRRKMVSSKIMKQR